MKAEKYVCRSQKYDLCICDKVLIARANANVLLNKCGQLVSKCRHRNKFTLKYFKDRSDNLSYSLCVIILISIIENQLMIEEMKHNVMVICCYSLPPTYVISLCFT